MIANQSLYFVIKQDKIKIALEKLKPMSSKFFGIFASFEEKFFAFFGRR
jgi:hypothetical protein